MTTRSAIVGILGLQVVLAVLLMGRDLVAAIPFSTRDSASPQFDRPVAPGDQTRRYKPDDMPLAPPRDGNPTRVFETTGDMPKRLAFSVEGPQMTLTGAIADGDAERAISYLEARASDVQHVRLNSPGGSVRDALAIGRALRDRELGTRLEAGDICLSACPYILAGGVTRQVDDLAQVGVHQHYFDANSVLPAFLAVESIQAGQGDVMAHFKEMGVDPLVMLHALRTPPKEIYVLLPEQLQTYKLSTKDP